MAASNGPDLVTEGCVLALDAANGNSYPGTGTVWGDLSLTNERVIATLVNTPTYISGSAFSFNGTNQYCLVGANTNYFFTGTTPFSMCAWVKTNSSSGEQTIFGRYNSNVLGNYHAGISNNKIYFQREVNGIGSTIISTNAIQTGIIYNLCYIFTGTTLTMYINGVIDPTTGGSGSNGADQSSVSLLLGARQTSSVASSLLNGTIYQMTIYRRALSTSEILQNFNAMRGRYGV